MTNHGIVMALGTDIQFIRPLAVRMSIALTLDSAVGPDIAEVTATLVWLKAYSADAT